MNLSINPKYSTYSTSIILHLLHNSEAYKNLWVKNYPSTSSQAENFFKNKNCGCKPVLIQNYKKFRFEIDFMTVQFLQENPNVLDIDKFCQDTGSQDLRGGVFVIKNTVSDYRNFLATLHEKRSSFDKFNAITIGDNIVVNFF